MKVTPNEIKPRPEQDEAHNAIRVLWTYLNCKTDNKRAQHVRTVLDDVFTQIGEDYIQKNFPEESPF